MIIKGVTACVVITDQIAAKGKEDCEENEMGRVLPMTAGGLEYFVDVMVEMEVLLEGFEQVRVARVVKSNSPDFPVGLELRDPSFADFLARLGDGPNPEAAEAAPAVLDAPEPEEHLGPTLEALLEQADAFGLARTDLLIAARHYCGAAGLDRLTPAQIDDLLTRIIARYAEAEPATTSTSGRAKTTGTKKR